VYFALAPRDARDQAHHVEPYLDEGDLMRMGGFEVVLRPVANGRAIPPSTADTLAPEPAIPGRAAQLRRQARERTGLPQDIRQSFNRHANSPTEPPQGPQWIPDVAGSNFDAVAAELGGDSQAAPQAGRHANSHGDQHLTQHAAMNSTFWLLGGDEEDRWTGTD
jgi:hypothetical protein